MVLRKELDDRCRTAAFRPEWGDVLRDLNRLQQGMIESGGKTWNVRTEATGTVTSLFKLVKIALPPRIQAIPPSVPRAPAGLIPKHRGRPRQTAAWCHASVNFAKNAAKSEL